MATVQPFPDLYGQVHPNETKELISKKLIEFENELGKIPSDKKEAADQANKNCPDIVNDEFKLMFLRSEVFNADLAAKRYASYWRKRLTTFGKEKAFLPITQKEALKDDDIAMKLGFIQVMGPKDPTGRGIIFVDTSVLSKTKYTRESMCRVIWYCLHALLEDEETQKKGVVILVSGKGLQYSQLDLDFVKYCCTCIKGCVPMRISGMHLCYPPTFFRLVFPIIKMLLGERLRKRIHIHPGSEEHFQRSLEPFGLTKEVISSKLGGKIVLDQLVWLQNRINFFE